MGANNMAVKILKKSIVCVVYVAIIILLIQGGKKAYTFGKAVFLDEAMTSEEEARDVTVTIEQGDSALDIGKMLERRGLIKDAYVFWAQSYCYEAGRKMKPGSYDLTTGMNAKEMMSAIVSQNSSSSKQE